MSRDCGPCQACCEVFDIGDTGSAMYSRCAHQCAQGCDVYAARPAGCLEYMCDWLGGLWPEDARPDRLGLILDTVLTSAPEAEDLPFVRVMEARPKAIEEEPRARAFVSELARAHVVQVVWWGPWKDTFRGPEALKAEILRRLAQLGTTTPR